MAGERTNLLPQLSISRVRCAPARSLIACIMRARLTKTDRWLLAKLQRGELLSGMESVRKTIGAVRSSRVPSEIMYSLLMVGGGGGG